MTTDEDRTERQKIAQRLRGVVTCRDCGREIPVADARAWDREYCCKNTRACWRARSVGPVSSG